MTPTTLLWIIFVLFILIFFVASYLLTYLFGKRSVVDTPSKGAVFVLAGHSVGKPIKAKLIEVGKRGSLWQYGKHFVMMPISYKQYYFCNRVMMFVKHTGQIVSSPFDKDKQLTDSEQESLIYELVAGKIGADGMRALKGKQGTNAIIIGIVAFLIGALISYGIVSYMNATQPQPQNGNVEQSQPNGQKLIEVE